MAVRLSTLSENLGTGCFLVAPGFYCRGGKEWLRARAALKSQLELQAKLAAALEGRGRLSVEVVSEPGAQPGAPGDAPQAARP